MEADWYADRARLRCALRDHPDWSGPQLARWLGRSISWVKKWRRRLRAAPPDDDGALHSHSRARKHPPAALPRPVVDRILAIRDEPPANLRRIPGPRTVLYFLWQDAALRAARMPLPRSAGTVWQVLRRHGRIADRRPRRREPVDLPEPLTSWQLDFKDVSSVPGDPEGKRGHVVETLDYVDCGTSLLLEAQVREDFTEETTLAAVADMLREHGLPDEVTIDRDPRFVGAPGAGDFPAPFIRFLTCLGVRVRVIPPRRPDRNAFVERYHGTYERECLRIHRPTTLEGAREVTAAFRQHYNEERPNQARSCGNCPPRVAFPALPPRPAVPAEVDPDGWLHLVEGRRYVRTVLASGTVVLDQQRYYVGRCFAGQRVALAVMPGERALVVHRGGTIVKRLPLRGLREARLDFDRYVELTTREARAQARRRRCSPEAA